MTGTSSSFRRRGLYYPYFHVRDPRWLMVAALYWPKLVRIVPEGHETNDPPHLRALVDDFIVSRPPGPSVEAVAPLFLDLVTNYADQLRDHACSTQCSRPV